MMIIKNTNTNRIISRQLNNFNNDKQLINGQWRLPLLMASFLISSNYFVLLEPDAVLVFGALRLHFLAGVFVFFFFFTPGLDSEQQCLQQH